MNIVIGSDHRGFMHKEFIKVHLKNLRNNNVDSRILSLVEGSTCPTKPWRSRKDQPTITYTDVGTFSNDRTDYPLFAQKACEEILARRATKGILLCASGIGMAIVANRFPSIYAGVAWNNEIAAMAAQDDNVNVLVLPTDFVSPQESVAILVTWLSSSFKGGRYQERIDQIDAMK